MSTVNRRTFAATVAALLSAPFGLRSKSRPGSVTSRRYLDPGKWTIHHNATGESLHVFCDGVDVTRDSFEAQEGPSRSFPRFAADPQALGLNDQGWVKRHVRVNPPLKGFSGVTEILFGRVEFRPGDPLD